MRDLDTPFRSGLTRRLGPWFRFAGVLVVVLSCAQVDAGTLLGPVTNPLDLAVVEVTPVAVTLPSGGSYQFSARAILPDSVAVVPDVIWSATGGTISATGVFTAGVTPGTYQISAQIKGRNRSGSAPVLVAPSLTSLVLSPTTIALAERATQQFSVAGTWSDGSATVPAVTYAVTGGTITADGLYTAGSLPGTFSVIATQQGGSKADTAIVTIAAPAAVLLQMVLAPASIALAPGGTGQFTVAGTWSDGTSSVPAVTYVATGGTITAGGLYTAGGTAGTFRVLATQVSGTKVDTSAVTITTVPPTLTQMVMTPATLSLAPGGTGQFTVAGTWSDGTSSAPAVTYAATGGTITAGGLYTAGGTAGTFRVLATQVGGTKVDTSAVSITAVPPTLTQMVMTPATLSLAPGSTGQFTVTGTWSDGTSSAPAVAYSATGGTITASGLYTAGASAGTFRVIATQVSGTKVDTSVVTVAPLAPTALVLVTQPAGAVSGAAFTQQPVVELRNAQNQPVLQGGVSVTVAIASGAGSLGGTLTAATNQQGRAAFSGLAITGSGNYTLSFTAPGLAQAASQTVTIALPSLRALATARNFRMGSDVITSALLAGGAYSATLAAQYNSVTPDNAMKFAVLHTGPTTYYFADADQIVSFAQSNGMAVHGHTLVWGSSLPTWLTGGTNTKAQLLAILQSHIATVVGRYAGKLASWDVVNEAVSWNGKTGLDTTSFWLQKIGPEYIDSAFVWAHRADPTAKLYYNDYGAEGPGQKADSVLALVQRLQSRGVPINGVGFETHAYPSTTFPTGLPTEGDVIANFARFTNAGLDIRISEMDVMLPDTAGTAALATQAVVYQNLLDACLLNVRCTEFTTWGFTDQYSWIPSSFPGFGRALPFDLNYQPKPAFNSLAARLGKP